MGQSGSVAVSGCVIRRRMESRSSATSARRNRGNSTRRGSFARSLCGLTPRKGGNRPFRENGWRVPHARVSGFAIGCQRAPLGGLFVRRRTLGQGAWLALIRPAGPTRKWSRRA